VPFIRSCEPSEQHLGAAALKGRAKLRP